MTFTVTLFLKSGGAEQHIVAIDEYVAWLDRMVATHKYSGCEIVG